MTRRDLRNEAEHLPDRLEDIVALRRRIIDELGESRQVADGICMWLFIKAQREPDLMNSATRARYRKILGRLRDLEPVGPAGAKARARGETGRGDLRVVAPTANASASSAGRRTPTPRNAMMGRLLFG